MSCNDGPASTGDDILSLLIPITKVVVGECDEEQESNNTGCRGGLMRGLDNVIYGCRKGG